MSTPATNLSVDNLSFQSLGLSHLPSVYPVSIMSLPPLNPDKTASGIIVDPRTLERVVPASRRKDGS